MSPVAAMLRTCVVIIFFAIWHSFEMSRLIGLFPLRLGEYLQFKVPVELNHIGSQLLVLRRYSFSRPYRKQNKKMCIFLYTRTLQCCYPLGAHLR